MFRSGFCASLAFIALMLSACGQPALDPSDPNGKQAILDATNNYLTNGDCADAIATITPLYNSAYSDDQVRLITGSAYGCEAGINLFTTINNIVNDGGTITSGNVWGFFAQLFPSVSTDKVVASAGYGMEALMTVIPTGTVINPSDKITSDINNPGSLNYLDRTGDSNLFMLFMSMAAIGGPESRRANASYHPTNSGTPLPWNTQVDMDSEGATYTAGIFNFIDAIPGATGAFSASTAAIIQEFNVASFSVAFNQACDYGCKGTSPVVGDFANPAEFLAFDTKNTWIPTGCTLTNCGTPGQCPASIRDITSYQINNPKDPASCAAAGVINFLNNSAAGWM